jgi:hypothetical protein
VLYGEYVLDRRFVTRSPRHRRELSVEDETESSHIGLRSEGFRLRVYFHIIVPATLNKEIIAECCSPFSFCLP